MCGEDFTQGGGCGETIPGDPAVFDGGILDLQMPEVTLKISVS